MSVIAIATAPDGVTRVFFDCRDMTPDPADELWIRKAIEDSLPPKATTPGAPA